MADAVAVATLVLADHSDSLEAALTVDGARHGAVLGPITPSYAGIHQTRIDATLDQLAQIAAQ